MHSYQVWVAKCVCLLASMRQKASAWALQLSTSAVSASRQSPNGVPLQAALQTLPSVEVNRQVGSHVLPLQMPAAVHML